MSPSTPDKDALLPRAELRDEVVVFAKTLIVREMETQKLTYQTLANRLAPYGIRDTAAVLNTKIFRGTFSAAFFLTCMKALGVSEINLDELNLTVGGRELRLRREHYAKETRDHHKKVIAQRKDERKAAREKRAKRRDQTRA